MLIQTWVQGGQSYRVFPSSKGSLFKLIILFKLPRVDLEKKLQIKFTLSVSSTISEYLKKTLSQLKRCSLQNDSFFPEIIFLDWLQILSKFFFAHKWYYPYTAAVFETQIGSKVFGLLKALAHFQVKTNRYISYWPWRDNSGMVFTKLLTTILKLGDVN